LCDVLHIDCRLPDDPDEEAKLVAAAEMLAPGDMLVPFRLNYLRRTELAYAEDEQ
jgi:hypothetical protein